MLQVKRMERKRAEEKISEPEWMEKQLRSIQINTKATEGDDEANARLAEHIEKLQSIPKRKEEFERYDSYYRIV